MVFAYSTNIKIYINATNIIDIFNIYENNAMINKI